MKARAPRLRVSDLNVHEKLAMVSAWLPPGQSEYPPPPSWGQCRWRDWDTFIADYLAVRDELRVRFAHTRHPLFGELAHAYRSRHGLAALNNATCQDIKGDAW
jgi:hypothetical protein